MSLKTFIIVVTVMAAFHTTEASSNNIHQPSSSGHHGYNASPYPGTCPTWFVFNNATNQCECGDDLGGVVACDSENKRIYITSCYCMSEDEHFGPIVGGCSTNCYIPKTNNTFKLYYHLPRNVSELNSAMCANHWNRDGRLCGGCKDSYHPLVYSYDMKCVKCEDSRYNWLKFVVEAYVPLTFFFVFVISTGISASSPALEAFVVYSQTIATPANMRMVLEASYRYPKITLPTKLVGALYGIWNLDFFRTLLPPICLKISSVQALALDYLIAFYPLVLIIITYILIDLYERRFCLLVWMWKPFSMLFKSISDRVNVKSSIVNAFITFIILSYVKLLSVSFDLLNFTSVYGPDGNYFGTFLYYDASIGYFGEAHLPYGILAIAVSIVFIILPLLLSLLHPLSCMQTCIGKWPALRICLDSYQGYYKDGTEGTRDYRWFSGLYLFTRIALFVIYGFIKNSYFYSFASVFLLFIVALLIICQPFKPQFRKYNAIHAILFLNLSMWFTTATCVHVSALKTTYVHTASLTFCGVVASLPFLYVTYLVTKWICKHKVFQTVVEKHCRYCRYYWPWKLKNPLTREESHESIESIPYRIDHPDEQRAVTSKMIDSATSSYGTFE